MSFTKFHEIEEGASLKSDVCIIGAGPAGIALAKSLAGTNQKIMLVDSGGFDLDDRIQDLAKGETSGIEYIDLEAIRLRYFGGTTNHWASQSVPLERLDFQERPWVPNSGWPINYEDLMGFMPQAQELCGVSRQPFAWNYWQNVDGFPKFPLSQKNYRPVMLRFSQPVVLFGQAYRDDIRRADNVRCLLESTVVGFELDKEKAAIESVTVSHPATPKRRFSIAARYFVLATGGIENSRMLLAPGGRSGRGIGNANDLVGRYFMEHPNYDSGEIKLAQREGADFLVANRFNLEQKQFRLDFRLSDERQKDLKILNHTAFLTRAIRRDHTEPDLADRATKLWGRIENKVSKILGIDGDSKKDEDLNFYLRVRLEQAPIAESRIKISKQLDAFGLPLSNLHLQLSELEGKTLQVLQEQVAAELGRAGLGRMRITFDKADTSWQGDLGWQIHHMGGTRMHRDPRRGVVDENCRVHETRNLFVAGSSVFPSGGHANPTMNLVALAFRLAEHLKKELAR